MAYIMHKWCCLIYIYIYSIILKIRIKFLYPFPIPITFLKAISFKKICQIQH